MIEKELSELQEKVERLEWGLLVTCSACRFACRRDSALRYAWCDTCNGKRSVVRPDLAVRP